MDLLRRFGYYIGGFAIGLVILAFFLNGSKTSCSYDYGPDARVLKDISSKNVEYSKEVSDFMAVETIDTTQINYILYKGDVNFSKSESRKKPCGIYFIEGKIGNKETGLLVKNCNQTATIESIEFLD